MEMIHIILEDALTMQQMQVMDLIRILYGALTAILFTFGADLMGRYLTADKHTRSDPAYMIFFVIANAVIGYGFYMLFAIVNYKLITDIEGTDATLALQYFFTLLILVALSSVCERIIFKKLKFRLGFIIGVIAIIYFAVIIVIEFINPDILNRTPWIPIFLLFIFFGIEIFFGILIIFFVRLRPQREITRKIVMGLIIGIIGLIGGLLAIPGRTHLTWVYVIGTMFEIAGWLGLRYYILSIRSYSEIEWRDGMIELHIIMAETGISLYFRSFRRISSESLKGDLKVEMTIPESERPNTDLIGGGMVGIKTMLGEIAGTKGTLENIKIGEKNLTFKHGKVVMALMLTDEQLGVYNALLFDMVEEIEAAHPNLANFNGDTRTLHMTEIVDRYFGKQISK
jgi:hypothetical protein